MSSIRQAMDRPCTARASYPTMMMTMTFRHLQLVYPKYIIMIKVE